MYSLIQFTTITFLYSFASSLGDFQFLYIDLFIIIPIAVASEFASLASLSSAKPQSVGRTLPYEYIAPQRPTASLVSTKVLSSILGQILITSLTQAWVFFWVRSREWYQSPPPPIPGEGLETNNFENTVLFLVSCFQYILVAAVFSIGPPYRKPMWTNGLSSFYFKSEVLKQALGWLMASIASLTVFSTWVLVTPTISVQLILNLMYLPWSARLVLILIALVNVLASFAYEAWIHEPIATVVQTLWKAYGRRRRREGRIYESVGRG